MSTELIRPPDKDEDTESTSSRKMDPELKAMSALLRTLDDLDEPAKGRVIAWLYARYTQECQR